MNITSSVLSERSNFIDSSEIRKVFDLAKNIKKPLNLSIGQPDFAVPDPVKAAMIKAIQDNLNAYTTTKGIQPLRDKLAIKYSTLIGEKYDSENIIISGGTAAILKLLFEILFNKGDGILMPDPYFLIYQGLAKYHQLNPFYFPENFLASDLEKIDAQKNRIKMMIFSSPSNPSGKIFTSNQLKLLAEYARKNNIIVVADEIYQAYDYDNKFDFMAKYYPEGTLILNGFSKSHAMTGLRVGYLIAPNQLSFVIEKIATLQQYSVVCAPQPSQWGALAALDVDIAPLINLMRKRRDIVLQKLSGKAEFVYPDGAFYLFCDVPTDSREFIKRAIAKSLLVVPGYIFSRNEKTIRISYAQADEILKEGLDVFLELLTDSNE